MLRLRLKRYLEHENLDRRILHSVLGNNQDPATAWGHNCLHYWLPACMDGWMNKQIDHYVIKTESVQFMKTG
jgi:hypothetical protein